MNPATLTDLRAFVQAGVRRVGKRFTAPEHDWEQMLFVQDERGVEIIHLSHGLFASGQTKDILGEMIRLRMIATGVYRYALLANMHRLEVDPHDPVALEAMERVQRGEVRVEQLEGAVEQLLLTVGDAEEEQVWAAVITRTPRMLRTLGPWENYSADPDTTFDGRFAGLNEYLRQPRARPGL